MQVHLRRFNQPGRVAAFWAALRVAMTRLGGVSQTAFGMGALINGKSLGHAVIITGLLELLFQKDCCTVLPDENWETGGTQLFMKRIRLILIALLALFVVGVAACAPVVSLDTTIELKAKESWSVEILAAFFEQDAIMNQSTIEQTLDQAVEGLVSQGVDATWKRDDGRGAEGSAVYLIELRGEGFALLNRAVLQQPGAFSASSTGNQKQINVSLMPQISLGQVQTVRYTVKGAGIITTNGTVFDKQTVFWLNPNGVMQATLKEPAGNQWLAYGLIFFGLLLLGGSIFGFINLPRRVKPAADWSLAPRRTAEPGMAFCENCQAEIPSQAVYCPNCGQRREVHT